MGQRGSRRRAKAANLAIAYALSIVVVATAVGALCTSSPWMLRAIAAAAAVGGVVAMSTVRRQLLVERANHGEERARLAQEYSRLTNARVVDNAEFVDVVRQRMDQLEHEVAAVVRAGDTYSTEDAPTVVTLEARLETGAAS